jgi:large repetitive protein
VAAGVQDVSGNALAAPVTTTFTTGTGADLVAPTVASVSPANGANGVPTNAVVQLRFSKRIDPYTVNGGTFYVYAQDTGMPVAANISVSADGLTATLAPAGALQTETSYTMQVTNGITDLEGQGLPYSNWSFTTGLTAASTGPTVVSVSPQNGAAGVPVNARVDVLMSVPVDAVSVVNGTVTVNAGGVSVAGVLGVSGSDVTFTPSSLLAASTSYTVNVSGITDQAGNVVVPFSSTFTTGTSGVANTTQPLVVGVSPANNATGVSVTTSVVLTFNEAIDPATVNASTFTVSVNGLSGGVAGSYTVSGSTVTFTPATPLPGNATVQVIAPYFGVQSVTGLTSNNYFSSQFTTAAVTDTTAPQVVMVTPGNGMSGVGLNAVVTLTFSKSLNPNTVTASNFGLLANGSKLGISLSHSADNSVVTLSAGILPATSVVTVLATSGVTDLSGNALSSFESSFTTGAADTGHPAVVSQRPGNSATGVPLNSSVVLYLSEAMNTGTVTGALHVSQNGVLASGNVQVTDNGQVVTFTPTAPWQNNALIQVFLDNTALDVDGSPLSPYQGSFTTAVDTSTVASAVVSTSPAYGTGGVPTNVVIELAYNEPLNPATVNSTNVILQPGFYTPLVASTVNLLGGGTIIQIIPNAPLAANTQYVYQVSNLQGSNGLAVAHNYWFFTTGSGTDTVAPTVVSVSPPNGSTNVGDNIDVHVVFSKAIDPVTVSASSIQLTGGGTTQVADAISFGNNNQSVVLVPHGPLPDNTVMTLAISGVLDVAGNAVVAQTTTFKTGTGPDLTSPVVVAENPYANETGVPLNAAIQLQANKPLDPGSVNGNTLQVQDSTTGQYVAGSYSVSADGRTASFVPSAALAVSRTFNVYFQNRGITDLAGNTLSCAGLCNFSFTTGAAANTVGPQVVGVSPANGLTGVPINAQVVVQFTEPVDGATLGQVVLSGSSGNVNGSERLTNGNQTLTLVPVVPLATNTTYTVTVAAGVQDVSGNALAAPVTTTFTTGTGADLTTPSVVAAGLNSTSSLSATDTFNRANQNPIASPWTSLDPIHLGTGQILNNQFESSVVGNSDSVNTGTSPWPNDQGSKITVGALNSSSYMGVDLRAQNLGTASGKTYRCYVGPGATGSGSIPWGIQFYSAGNFYQLASGTLTGGIQAGDTLEADVTGTLITLFHNGISVGSVSDSNLSSGQPGIFTAPGGSTANSIILGWSGLVVSGAGNPVVQVRFSKPIDPLTATTSTLIVYPTSTGIPVSGTVTVSGDGLTATFTPAAPFSTTVTYQVQVTNGILDLEGQPISTFYSTFQ